MAAVVVVLAACGGSTKSTIGRDTALSVIECKSAAGTPARTAALVKDLTTLKAAVTKCQHALDLLNVDYAGANDKKPIAKLKVLISARLEKITIAVTEDESILQANVYHLGSQVLSGGSADPGDWEIDLDAALAVLTIRQ